MATFRVELPEFDWSIDVEADDPCDAAESAIEKAWADWGWESEASFRYQKTRVTKEGGETVIVPVDAEDKRHFYAMAPEATTEQSAPQADEQGADE